MKAFLSRRLPVLIPTALLWAIPIVYLANGKGRAAAAFALLAAFVSILPAWVIYSSWSYERHKAARAALYAGEKIKMYIICSKEALNKMKGVRGKMINQGGHATLHAFWDAERRFPDQARAYREHDHAYKITLVVPTDADLARIQNAYADVCGSYLETVEVETEDDLVRLKEAYEPICGVSLVKDAGFTVFKNEDGTPRPTITYLGLGPIPESLMGDDLRKLKPLT